MKQQFSVLMSIYIKEQPKYVRQCFDSLLKQTVLADEWIIVEDGPLTNELYEILEEYEERYVGLIKRIALKQNVGLGLALNEGILHCTYDLIARMDTDDVSRKDRFEKQLKEFEENPQLDICGSHILEFEDSINKITSYRKVPIEDSDIKKYQKRRDAFNHMTVMYKKNAVLNAGNYQHAMLMEDTLLWVNMILTGAQCANVDDYLVWARTGKNLYERRGGWTYFHRYCNGRKKILETGYISYWDYIITILAQLIVAMVPSQIRKKIFQDLLHH